MKNFNYGELLAFAISNPHAPTAEYVEDETFSRTAAGAEFRLPTMPFLQFGISADDPGGTDVRDVLRGPDFPIERATQILDRMTVFEVAETRGHVPSGNLPSVSMQGESMTAGADGDPGIADRAYHCASVVEAKSSYSGQLVLEAGRSINVSAFIEDAHRQAIRQALLTQVVNGDGQTPSLAGVLSAAGIGAATYAQTDRGKEDAFTLGESTLEDADADPGAMAWLLGSDLHDSAKGALLEPGSDRRTLERGRMSVSGYQTYRSDSALPATTGLLCDWSSIVLVMQGALGVTVDRVTKPGTVRVTSRLNVADPVVTRPTRAYKLEQA